MSNSGPPKPWSKSHPDLPIVIGLLGGVASGKSFVARRLEELGAALLDADGAGHEVLRTPEVEALARARWGDGVFGPDGRIVRKALAAIVFRPGDAGRRELTYLEQITHPRIGERLRAQLQAAGVQGVKALILDAPVLLEAGWDALCDRLVFVDSPEDQRLERARSRGWSEEEFRRREGAQVDLTEKRARADFVIDNSGSKENTISEVDRFWRSVFG
jgi:dephospho-CoA kinase